MSEIWYAILVGMLTAFVVLEGWDFGACALHFAVGRNERDRGVVIRALGPLWIWNEVWLVAFGGVTFSAFPEVLASAFSGFYLALFLLLWCLVLRGLAIEVRGHQPGRLWREGWDFTLAVSNVLLCLLVGIALGNVIRGVPLRGDGTFTLPFFSNFGVRGEVGILDWYTLSFGLLTLVLFGAHGASYLVLRTLGTVHDRSETLTRWLWPAAALLIVVVTLETYTVRPEMLANILHRPIGWMAAAGAMVGGAFVGSGVANRRERTAFGGSCTLIASLMATGAAAVFPTMLHSTRAEDNSITIYTSGTDTRQLGTALVWWSFAIVLSLGYFTFISRYYRGKVCSSTDESTSANSNGSKSETGN
jgi:cytochrome d ubiquinol oxidase subunit II